MSNNSTTVSNVIPFNFGKQQVRTLLIDDQPWFVAADVCASLAIGNVSLAVNGRADRETDGLDEDEKGIATVNTPSGAQEMLIVSESGLYALIFKSRKAEAKRFKKWVTVEVLPAIRKHGRYEDAQGNMQPMLDELLGPQGARKLGNIMRCRVAKLDTEYQRSATAKLASALHARFDVPRIELIPGDQLDVACNFVASYAIEGEYLERESTALNTLTDKELYDVFFLMHHFLAVKRIYDGYQLGAALRMLGSEAGCDMRDHFIGSMAAVSTLKKRLPDMEAAAVRIGLQPGTVTGRAAA